MSARPSASRASAGKASAKGSVSGKSSTTGGKKGGVASGGALGTGGTAGGPGEKKDNTIPPFSTTTRGAEHSGRPGKDTTPETLEKIHDMVLPDRRLKKWKFVEEIGISHGSVVSILNDHLGMIKLSARQMI
ncbi:unnamed protein product [Acanthoscelides obtectus]|uniref:Uncharacterized protein n=1 Tax=Acanthoscelides obtectus TaxID=200917 RepID=A0A9P0JN40_ACAOB|nr:unnamed protein product [Acanthoscelides obtectus]CAK1661582.1 hypothetical protein AOBTE_LOCUS22696 [Acanthoscelides obtectus]